MVNGILSCMARPLIAGLITLAFADTLLPLIVFVSLFGLTISLMMGSILIMLLMAYLLIMVMALSLDLGLWRLH